MFRTLRFLTPPAMIGLSAATLPTALSAACKPNSKADKVKELYDDEPVRPNKGQCDPSSATELEKCIAKCREEFGPMKTATEEYLGAAVQYSRETTRVIMANVDYLQNCAPKEIQYGAIVGAGLVGMMFGFRRGLIRKVLYGGIGAGAMAAVIYPEEAKVVGRQGLELAKTYSTIAYNFMVGTGETSPGNESSSTSSPGNFNSETPPKKECKKKARDNNGSCPPPPSC